MFFLIQITRQQKKFVPLPISFLEMVKNYFHIITLFFCFLSFNMNAQEIKAPVKNQETSIEGLSFYPNPVSNGKIYITTKLALENENTIFDVLGKRWRPRKICKGIQG
jgi:hypothetical protein